MYLFLLLPILLIAADVYIFIKGKRALKAQPKSVKIIAMILFFVCALGIVPSMMLHGRELPFGLTRFFSDLTTDWMIFVLYMTLLLLVTEIPLFFHKRLKKSFLICFVLTICIMLGGYIHYMHPGTKVMNIVINKQVASAKKWMKVVAVSDLHLGYATDVKMLQRYVTMINNEKPDLILIGGDLVDRSVAPLYEEPFAATLNQLKARYGIFMVPGNHDYYANVDSCSQFVRQTSIVMLRDSVVTLRNGFQIVGRDDRSNSNRLPLETLMKRTKSSRPIFLLDHQPYELRKSGQLGVDLEFCGHTHNGQVWPFNLVEKLIFELPYGYRQYGRTQVYVSSGLSLWGPPMRIGTQSEMLVFNLTFK